MTIRNQVSCSEQETAAMGRRLADTLNRGDMIVLSGQLGVGKTVFVRGLAEGFGLDPREVRSPSFTLLRTYGPTAAGLRLVHADLYRLDTPAESEDLGLAEQLLSNCVVVVEWGEKLAAPLKHGAIRIMIEDDGGDRRCLRISR